MTKVSPRGSVQSWPMGSREERSSGYAIRGYFQKKTENESTTNHKR